MASGKSNGQTGNGDSLVVPECFIENYHVSAILEKTISQMQKAISDAATESDPKAPKLVLISTVEHQLELAQKRLVIRLDKVKELTPRVLANPLLLRTSKRTVAKVVESVFADFQVQLATKSPQTVTTPTTELLVTGSIEIKDLEDKLEHALKVIATKLNLTPIDHLNDACMREIFAYFNLNEILYRRSVCKTWKAFSEAKCRTITSLTLVLCPRSMR